MQKERKTEKLNLRVQPTIKDRLIKYADKNHWSLNQAACLLFNSNLPNYELSDNAG